MTKLDKQILALTAAAKKQPDPVKREKILRKIEEVRRKINHQKWLGQ
jgi:hypothetical protein